jgi:hypothetical protein
MFETRRSIIENWNVGCCGKAPREEVIFICQVIIALIVIVCGLLNISLTEQHTSLWATLVSGAVGYLIPGPRLVRRPQKDESLLHDATLEFVDGSVPEQHGGEIHDDPS